MAEDNKEQEEKLSLLRSRIKSYPDFPKKGILFWDIFSALSDGPTCALLQSLLIGTIKRQFPQVEAIVGLDARGFLFAFSLAQELKVGCVPVRKKGKLPGEVLSYSYELEYGTDTLEVQKASIRPGIKCVILDDLIATGGTLGASISLLQRCGAQVLGALVVLELESLHGRKNLPADVPVTSLLQYD